MNVCIENIPMVFGTKVYQHFDEEYNEKMLRYNFPITTQESETKSEKDLDKHPKAILYRPVGCHEQTYRYTNFCFHGLDLLSKYYNTRSFLSLAFQSHNKSILKEISRQISQQFIRYVENLQNDLLYNVWVGYTHEDNNEDIDIERVRIVALYNKFCVSFVQTFWNIKILWRHKDNVSREAEENVSFENKSSVKGLEITGTEAECLFNSHRYLNIIHLSSFRSTNFQTFHRKRIYEPCVALYCQVKGIIPLGENPFPKMIGNLKTDVREAHLMLGAVQPLAPGDSIWCTSTCKSGTIGGYLELSDGRIVFATAAHIVSTCNILKQSELEKKTYFKSGITVSKTGSYQSVGTVIAGGVFNENPQESSVDAVTVEVDRQHMDPNFKIPKIGGTGLKTTGVTVNSPVVKWDNKIIPYDEICRMRGPNILKFGAATGVTVGCLAIDGVHTRFDCCTTKLSDGIAKEFYELKLYNQMAICNGETKFFDSGDSGSFCYMFDNDNSTCTLHPCGMAIGTSNAFCIATPLEAIFEKLGLDFKRGDTLLPLLQYEIKESTCEDSDAEQAMPQEDTIEVENKEMKDYDEIGAGIMKSEVEKETETDFNTTQEDLLYKAIENKNLQQIRICLDGCDLFSKNAEGKSILQLSLQSRDTMIIKEIARKIRRQFITKMQRQNKQLLSKVWLGYVPQDKVGVIDIRNVRIVALHNKEMKPPLLETFMDIVVYWRREGKVSEESRETVHYENSDCFPSRKVTGEQAQQLFASHSQLSIIHVSSYRSRNFLTLDRAITREPCVALYCQVKGIIPFGEDKFPKMIGDLSTDVREGYAAFGAGELLRPGSMICCPKTNTSGTIGGFVEYPDGKLAFITVAHLVAKCDDLKKSGIDKKVYFEREGIEVCRGSDRLDRIGIVTKGCFWNDDPSEPSVDAVLVKVDRNVVATNFKFPTTDEQNLRLQGYTYATLPKIIENKILTLQEVDANCQADVLKYGATTELTKGKLVVNGMHIKQDTGPLTTLDYDENNQETNRQEFNFFHQMGINRIGQEKFFDSGDSGSFCYMIDKNDGSVIRPFGMAIAQTDVFCIVTPLQSVFEKLGLDLNHNVKLYPLPQDNASLTETGIQTDSRQEATGETRQSDDLKVLILSMIEKQDKMSGEIKSLTQDVNAVKKDVDLIKSQILPSEEL